MRMDDLETDSLSYVKANRLMNQSISDLQKQVERLGGTLPPGKGLLEVEWPVGWVYRLGPKYNYSEEIRLGAKPTESPKASLLQDFQGAVCFACDEGNEKQLYLLPNGNAFVLETFLDGEVSEPEPVADLLSRLAIDVFMSDLTAAAKPMQLFRTFNESTVLVCEDGRRVFVLEGGHGFSGHEGEKPGTIYEVDALGSFEFYGMDDPELDFVVSNGMSLREALPSAPIRIQGDNAPLFPDETLHADIVLHLQRLGGVLVPNKPNPDPLVWNGNVVLEPVRRYLMDVKWPSNRAFANGENDLWVWKYVPAIIELGSEPHTFLRENRSAIGIGIADGGNQFLAMLVDGNDPSDPLVYRLDHDDLERVSGPVKLSKFLASLWPDVLANRETVPPATGRLFQTTNRGLVWVRSTDRLGADVVLVCNGFEPGSGVPHGWGYSGDVYRVNSMGVYEGSDACNLRLRLSLAEMLNVSGTENRDSVSNAGADRDGQLERQEELSKQLHENILADDSTLYKRLASLKLQSGRLAVTDSLAIQFAARNHASFQLPSDSYLLLVGMSKDQPNQIKRVRAIRGGMEPVTRKRIGSAATDHASIAIFAVDEFERLNAEAWEELLTRVYRQVEMLETFEMIECYDASSNLAIVRSGTGDGSYPVYELLTSEGEAAGLEIVFVE